MYFPKGFHQELAIELGELITSAYDQFSSSENDKMRKTHCLSP
jgi:hypothetical protein